MPGIGIGDYTVQADRETAEALFGPAPGDGPYVTLGIFRARYLPDPAKAAAGACGDLNMMIERLAPNLTRAWVWSAAEILAERKQRTGTASVLIEGPS